MLEILQMQVINYVADCTHFRKKVSDLVCLWRPSAWSGHCVHWNFCTSKMHLGMTSRFVGVDCCHNLLKLEKLKGKCVRSPSKKHPNTKGRCYNLSLSNRRCQIQSIAAIWPAENEAFNLLFHIFKATSSTRISGSGWAQIVITAVSRGNKRHCTRRSTSTRVNVL